MHASVFMLAIFVQCMGDARIMVAVHMLTRTLYLMLSYSRVVLYYWGTFPEYIATGGVAGFHSNKQFYSVWPYRISFEVHGLIMLRILHKVSWCAYPACKDPWHFILCLCIQILFWSWWLNHVKNTTKVLWCTHPACKDPWHFILCLCIKILFWTVASIILYSSNVINVHTWHARIHESSFWRTCIWVLCSQIFFWSIASSG